MQVRGFNGEVRNPATDAANMPLYLFMGRFIVQRLPLPEREDGRVPVYLGTRIPEEDDFVMLWVRHEDLVYLR